VGFGCVIQDLNCRETGSVGISSFGKELFSLGGTLAYSGTSQGAVNVGNYGITPAGLTSGNYDITFVPGSLMVTLRQIEVTADSLIKTFGQADPALTYKITGGELVEGDAFTGALVRVAGEDVGRYRILQGTLTLGANYELTFIEGTLDIAHQLPITGGEFNLPALGLAALLVGAFLAFMALKLKTE